MKNYTQVLTDLGMASDIVRMLNTSTFLENIIQHFIIGFTDEVARHEEVKFNKDGEPESFGFGYEVVLNVLKGYNEPLLNLHFFSPYVKDHQTSFGAYNYIYDLLPLVPDPQITKLLELLRYEIGELKKAIH